jgi:hypothetical protein
MLNCGWWYLVLVVGGGLLAGGSKKRSMMECYFLGKQWSIDHVKNRYPVPQLDGLFCYRLQKLPIKIASGRLGTLFFGKY